MSAKREPSFHVSVSVRGAVRVPNGTRASMSPNMFYTALLLKGLLFLFFYGPFFIPAYRSTSNMYCCTTMWFFIISSTVPRAQYSTAQHSTAAQPPLPVHKAANQVLADQSATTRLSRQTWRELACRAVQCCAVPFLSCLSKYVRIHACGVRVLFLEYRALGICKSPAGTYNVGLSTTSAFPFHSSL